VDRRVDRAAAHIHLLGLYPFILLNLCLSCLAAVQGIILQISANRGDKVNAVIALHTEDNTDKLAVIAQHNEQNTNKLAAQSDQILDLQKQQLDMLKSLHGIQVAIDGIQARLADLTPPFAGSSVQYGGTS
jgi:uncharacterized membrane protein